MTFTADARPAAPCVSCIIPALNEAANLRQLLPRLSGFLAERFEEWEIVLVDDGSRDGTGALIDEWAAQCPQFCALQLSRNFGKEAALTAGLEAARGDVMVQLDADLQHPPELIDRMIERWRAGADVVYAVREDRSAEAAT
jgi:glycosyltransferase involved in cell wall biosynthesis